MTDLLLIRHGQASHNVEGRLEGWGSAPLTLQGEREAGALARRLASWSPLITQVYASPLLRAWQTAEFVGRELGLEPRPHQGLKEIDFGRAGGLTLEALRDAMPQLYARWQDRGNLDFRWPGGERRRTFFRRVASAIDEIWVNHPGEQVAIVAHGGTLRAGLAHLFPDTMHDWWAYALHNASLTHVRILNAGNSLLSLNDCQHLDGRVNP
jgi:probable phosphoglycerate mutase